MNRILALVFVVFAPITSCGDDDDGGTDAAVDTGTMVDAGPISAGERCRHVFTAVCGRAIHCGLNTQLLAECLNEERSKCCEGGYCTSEDDVPQSRVAQCVADVEDMECTDLQAAAEAAFPDHPEGEDIPLEEQLFPDSCAGLFRFEAPDGGYF